MNKKVNQSEFQAGYNKVNIKIFHQEGSGYHIDITSIDKKWKHSIYLPLADEGEFEGWFAHD